MDAFKQSNEYLRAREQFFALRNEHTLHRAKQMELLLSRAIETADYRDEETATVKKYYERERAILADLKRMSEAVGLDWFTVRLSSFVFER